MGVPASGEHVLEEAVRGEEGDCRVLAGPRRDLQADEPVEGVRTVQERARGLQGGNGQDQEVEGQGKEEAKMVETPSRKNWIRIQKVTIIHLCTL